MRNTIQLENENGIFRWVEVEFDYTASRISRDYYEPNEPEELTIHQVFFKGIDITEKLSKEFLEHVEEETYRQIIEG